MTPSIKEALELLPCPFCGGTDIVCCDQGDDDFAVTCKSCGASSKFDDVESEAVKAWNTRATLQPSGERREAIARIIDPTVFDVDWMHRDDKRYVEALTKADQILASGLVQNEAGISPFKPCFLVNEGMNLVEVHFEDASYTSKPLIDGVYHWIDQHIAHDDGRVVGLTFWIYQPPNAIRSARLQQERDEAYERAAKVADTWEHTTEWVQLSRCVAPSEAARKCIAAAIRRLAAGPEKEKT